MRIELPGGARVPVRCKSPNKCLYCGTIVAIENAKVLDLDAADDRRPTVLLTLTTRDPIESAEFTTKTAVFWRAFRRRFGDVEFCGFIEWTTGEGTRAAGRRRLHAHYLVKDLDPRYALAEVEEWVRSEWKSLVGAWVVEVVSLRSQGGATAYLALHHRKQAQGPPRGWSGKRFRPSKGYFNRPVAELRREARLLLQESAAVKRGSDPALVRLRAVLDFMRGRVVPAHETDVQPTRGVNGGGYNESEFETLRVLALDGQRDEPEPDRLARVYFDMVRTRAKDRVDVRTDNVSTVQATFRLQPWIERVDLATGEIRYEPLDAWWQQNPPNG
jgi:hypothetical protein